MELTAKKLGMWSKMGSRATYGLAMVELAKEFEDLMVVTADTSTSAGLDRFRKKFKERYVDVGIAEQNAIGVAAGLASEGFNVFASTFAPFQTMRCCEQIKVNLCYMNHPVTIVGLASGVVLGMLGYTHCSIEDMAIMRSLPNMTVLSPADCGETAKAAWAAAHHGGPVYIRLTGDAKSPPVYTEDYVFEIGKCIQLKKGEEVAIIGTGTMVARALEAASLLEKTGVYPSVYNMHTIKPLDSEAVQRICRDYRLIVTVEEHNVLGGLGSAVAEAKAAIRNAPPQVTLGINDSYSFSGAYRDILDEVGLSSEKIATSIRNRLDTEDYQDTLRDVVLSAQKMASPVRSGRDKVINV